MKIFLKLSVCVVLVAAYIFSLCREPFSVVSFLLGVPVCKWLATLLHELSHLLSYFLLRLQWKKISLFCFVIEAGKGLRLERDLRQQKACCTCAYRPEDAFWKYRIALLSGGIVCVMLGAGAMGLSFAVGSRLCAFFQCYGVISLADGVINLLPFSADMALIRQIKKERQ